MKCVNCGRALSEAPTKLGNMDCGPHGKICFECIEKMYNCMQMVCVKEKKKDILVNQYRSDGNAKN